MTQSGDTATFRAAGVGRGTIYYSSQSAVLAALNGLAVVYEWDVDENGNANLKGWEWN
jgi:hypothetical protein